MKEGGGRHHQFGLGKGKGEGKGETSPTHQQQQQHTERVIVVVPVHWSCFWVGDSGKIDCCFCLLHFPCAEDLIVIGSSVIYHLIGFDIYDRWMPGMRGIIIIQIPAELNETNYQCGRQWRKSGSVWGHFQLHVQINYQLNVQAVTPSLPPSLRKYG